VIYPPALVLAKNYAPVSVFPKLSTASGKDALRKYLDNKCEVLNFYDRPVLSKGEPIEYPGKGMLFWPSVIVDYEKPIKNSIRLSLSVLYYRENCRCFWCKKEFPLKLGTKDHVYPESKGGQDTFENLVFACNPCNTDKADALPEGKWKPTHLPKKPTYQEILEKRRDHDLDISDESWIQYLPGFVNFRVNPRFNLDSFT
jgi:hypothetical protein